MKTKKFKKFCDDLGIQIDDLFTHEMLKDNNFGSVDVINFNPNFFETKMIISLIENNGIVVATVILPVQLEETLELYKTINEHNNNIVGSNFSFVDNRIVYRQQINYKDMSGYEVIEALSEFDEVMNNLVDDIISEKTKDKMIA